MSTPEKILAEMDHPASETGVSPSSGSSDFAAVRERIFGTKSKSPKRAKPSAASEETPGIQEKDLEKIFAGENWEEIAGLYFNARFAITGWEGFCLTEGQKKTLGLSLATTMKMLLKIDPGYIALVVFTTNFAGLIGSKELTYSKLKKQAEEKR